MSLNESILYPILLFLITHIFNVLQQGEEKVAYENFLNEKKMIDEIIAKVKEEERKKILDDMYKRQVEKETIRYAFFYQFLCLVYKKIKY